MSKAFSNFVLQMLNVGLGLFGVGMTGFGMINSNGLQGLGLILIMSSILCYIGFRFSAEQEQRESAAQLFVKTPVAKLPVRLPMDFAGQFRITWTVLRCVFRHKSVIAFLSIQRPAIDP
jgi:hypothetical protein